MGCTGSKTKPNTTDLNNQNKPENSATKAPGTERIQSNKQSSPKNHQILTSKIQKQPQSSLKQPITEVSNHQKILEKNQKVAHHEETKISKINIDIQKQESTLKGQKLNNEQTEDEQVVNQQSPGDFDLGIRFKMQVQVE